MVIGAFSGEDDCIMKRMVFGESVQGASHKRVDKECQDSFKKLEYDDGTVIMAIADGHGSKACLYSKSGPALQSMFSTRALMTSRKLA